MANGSPLGLAVIDLGAIAPLVTSPTYTDIFNETMGDAATDADGMAVNLDEINALSDAFGGEINDVIGSLAAGAVDAAGAGLDLAPLDATIGRYVGTLDVGTGIVADASALAPPQLLEFPINPNFATQGIRPPVLSTIDIGTVVVGGAPYKHLIGSSTPTATGTRGTTDVQLFGGDADIFKITVVQGPPEKFQDKTGNRWTDYPYSYYLVMTPTKAGQFIAQVNAGIVGVGFSIITFTVTITP